MERREAQGSHAEGPRALGPPPPQGRLGSRNLGAKTDPGTGSVKGVSHRTPGASRRSIPSSGKRKKGKDACRASLSNRRRSVGYPPPPKDDGNDQCRIWLRNSLVRSCCGLAKNGSGALTSTIW